MGPSVLSSAIPFHYKCFFRWLWKKPSECYIHLKHAWIVIFDIVWKQLQIFNFQSSFHHVSFIFSCPVTSCVSFCRPFLACLVLFLLFPCLCCVTGPSLTWTLNLCMCPFWICLPVLDSSWFGPLFPYRLPEFPFRLFHSCTEPALLVASASGSNPFS